MNIKTLVLASVTVSCFALPAMAQTAASETQRDVNQQDRIESGLQSGQLSTGEAARLENGEKRIDNAEAKDMKDGTLSAQDKAQIQAMQNKESARINAAESNGVTGNPASASSQRMQADVQRDANQEARINAGVKNGTVTDKEAASLERGQAKDDRAQAAAGANGNVSAREQAREQRKENRQSARVARDRHNGKNRKSAVAATPAQ